MGIPFSAFARTAIDLRHAFFVEQVSLLASSRFVTGKRRGKCHSECFSKPMIESINALAAGTQVFNVSQRHLVVPVTERKPFVRRQFYSGFTETKLGTKFTGSA